MSSTIRTNLAWSFFSRYLNITIQFVSVVVLARLLTPEEIGVYSIAVALFSLGQILRDFGIGEYIVQEKQLTREKIASAFTVSLLVAYSLALLFYFIGPAVSEFYQRPELIVLFQLLVCNFLMIPFGTLTLSLLRRQLEFKKLLLIELGSVTTYTLVAISAAYTGHSYLSLAWASLAGTAATILLALFFRPVDQPWLPSLSEVRTVGGFGWKMSYAQVVNHINRSAPELIIGKFLGASHVAIFGKAMSTTQLFTELVFNALVRVIDPVFAGKNRDGADLKEPFIRAVAMLTVIAWPFFGFFMLMADPIVRFLYGEQWVEAVPVLRIVCLAAMLFFTTSLSERVLVSMGRAARIAIIRSQFLVVALVCILIGSQYNLEAVAVAVVVERLYRVFILYREMRREMGIQLADFFSLIGKGGSITLLSLVGPALFYLNPDLLGGNHFLELLCAGSAWGLTWLGGVLLFSHPISIELRLLYCTLSARWALSKGSLDSRDI